MAKLKKHELLEKAMRDYPAGTVARFKSAPKVDHVSDGTFKIKEDDYNGIVVLDGAGVHCFYSENCHGERNPQWAIPTVESILSGKCAIQVNNEREFKLLMEHYRQNGWTSIIGDRVDELNYDYCFGDKRTIKAISYSGNFCFPHNRTDELNEDEAYLILANYKIIPFSDFATEVGIEVPVKINGLTTHDGADIYERDLLWTTKNTTVLGSKKTWTDPLVKLAVPKVLEEIDVNRDHVKAFSTKEAAEKWIAEKNKPKEVTVQLFFGGQAEVCSDHVYLHGGIKISPSDLEDMLNAYKSLQQ